MNDVIDQFRRPGMSRLPNGLLDQPVDMIAQTPYEMAAGWTPPPAPVAARDQFDFNPTPQQEKQALFSSLARMGAAMLANNRGPNAFASALGHGLGAQQEGYQGALQASEAANTKALQSQMLRSQFGEQQRQRTLQEGLRTALGKLDQNDPDYWGQVGRLYAAAGEMDTAMKAQELAGGGKPTEAIKNFRFLTDVMKQPTDKAMGVFTPMAPPSMQLSPGGDYRPDRIFNPRTGQITTVSQPPQPAVPVDVNAPWKNLPPKQADEMKPRVYMSDQKKLDELEAQLTAGRQTMADLQRFGELNRLTGTGGLSDKLLPDWTTTDEGKQEMLSITSRLAPNVRPAGSGTTSDKDLGLYLRGLPGTDKPGTVNKNIRDQFAKQLQKSEQRMDFMRDYLSTYGHLSGAYQAYQRAYPDEKGGKPAAPQPSRQAPAAPAQPSRAAFGSVVSRDMVQQAADKAGMSYADMAKALKSKGVRVQ